MRRSQFVTALAAGSVSLAGCAQQAARLPVDRVWTAADYQYQLGPGDELGVRFVLDPDLNAQVTIGPDGRAIFPLIRGLSVAGLTVEQADDALSKAYGSVLRKPEVELLVYSYASGQAYLAGEIKNPGARAIRGETSIVQAISDAGGFLPTAKVDRVVLLRRRGPGARVLMKVVNVQAILKGKTGEDVRLLPGDVVFVPRSTIAEADRIVQQYITGVIPFSVNYQLNSNGVLTDVVH